MMEVVDDLQLFRSYHESEEEWEMRRLFIEKYQGHFSKRRLQCLSRCYINVECYGCTYSSALMRTLKELTDQLPQIQRKDRDRKALIASLVNKVKFDKCENLQTVGVMDTSSDSSEESNSLYVEPVLKSKPLDNHERYPGAISIIQNGPHENNALDSVMVNSGPHNSQLEPDKDQGVVQLSSLFPGLMKLHEKLTDCDKPSNVTTKQRRKIPVRDDNEQKKTVPCNSKPKKSKSRRGAVFPVSNENPSIPVFKLQDFVIMESDINSVNSKSCQVLQNSANFNQVTMNLEVTDKPDGTFHCKMFLADIIISEAIANSKNAAKVNACDRALQILKGQCYTVIKKETDEEQDKVHRDEFCSKKAEAQSIPDTNIGNRMMKKMGWTEGGLGKAGNTGRLEPVIVDSAVNREGLGFMSEGRSNKEFVSSCKQTILDYIRSDKQEDLVFSCAFTKEERSMLHKEAQKHRLKSKSYGKGNERYLVLSRKRTASELLHHLLSNQGETAEYRLVQPNGC